ncbi:helix-turn-helix transcriptional regulator [Salinisphaera orenii]|uniref:helix-turn-helix transcriptional regulator n=1 Tax=Salinisphaera orenii TaxID=856731 RepID=UPI000DBE1E68
MEYSFTLKYRLPSTERDKDQLTERLYAGGCDDALIGVGQAGRVALEFAREAASAMSAMDSAMADVRRLVPGARLIEVAPDWVGLTDIAQLIGVSRQYTRKLMQANIDSFPVPVHEGTVSLWHFADVLDWLRRQDKYACPLEIEQVAKAALRVNRDTDIDRLEALESPHSVEA